MNLMLFFVVIESHANFYLTRILLELEALIIFLRIYLSTQFARHFIFLITLLINLLLHKVTQIFLIIVLFKNIYFSFIELF
jgi:hypothetical protein